MTFSDRMPVMERNVLISLPTVAFSFDFATGVQRAEGKVRRGGEQQRWTPFDVQAPLQVNITSTADYVGISAFTPEWCLLST